MPRQQPVPPVLLAGGGVAVGVGASAFLPIHDWFAYSAMLGTSSQSPFGWGESRAAFSGPPPLNPLPSLWN